MKAGAGYFGAVVRKHRMEEIEKKEVVVSDNAH